jgi:hypothetical protein
MSTARITPGRVRTFVVQFRCQNCRGSIRCVDGVGMEPRIARQEFARALKLVEPFARTHRCKRRAKRGTKR